MQEVISGVGGKTKRKRATAILESKARTKSEAGEKRKKRERKPLQLRFLPQKEGEDKEG